MGREDLAGTFWLVAFMTTDTVTTPHLATMTQQLLWANWRYRDEPDVGLLCLTLDAEHDTPEARDYVSNATNATTVIRTSGASSRATRRPSTG